MCIGTNTGGKQRCLQKQMCTMHVALRYIHIRHKNSSSHTVVIIAMTDAHVDSCLNEQDFYMLRS